MEDPTNPSHYKQGEIECIDAIRAALGHEQFIGYLRGSEMAYQWRFPMKGGEQDLRKAKWYLDRLISEMSKPEVAEAMAIAGASNVADRLRIAQGQVAIWQDRARLLDERCNELEAELAKAKREVEEAAKSAASQGGSVTGPFHFFNRTSEAP